MTPGFLRRSVQLCTLDSRPTMELRGAVRYRLGAPAVFFWEGAHGNRLQGEGVTRDISLSGAFLVSATSPPAKATIQIEIILPPLHNGAPRVRIQAEAQVVRVEPSSPNRGECGFAVVSVTGFNLAPLYLEDAAAPSIVAEKLGEVGTKKTIRNPDQVSSDDQTSS